MASRGGSLSKTLATRLEESEMRLETSHQVNAHLNAEVETLTKQLDKLREQNESYQRHMHDLAAMLAQQRRHHASGTDQVPAAEIDQLASPSQLPDSTAQVPNSGAPTNGASLSWASDVRWDELRKLGRAACWLVKVGMALGEGTFGTTYHGVWRGGDVAVKCVRISKQDEADSFLREVQVLACLRHPNIMPFYGACLKPPKHCWLLCEYLPGGTLMAWLYGDKNKSAPRRSLAARLQMALDVARGMQAMEEADPPIVHRDLKPSNVFIDAGGQARVADMGLARWLTAENMANLTGETGTYLYMSPEMIRHELYNSRTDVFSWGVMFVELLTQQRPYERLYMTPIQIALAVGDDQLRPDVPAGTPPDLTNLALSCFDGDPLGRPSFSLIVSQLSNVISKLDSRSSQQQGGADGTFSRLIRGRPTSLWNTFSAQKT
eukprot:jgi/Astpho2/2868/Aster-01022